MQDPSTAVPADSDIDLLVEHGYVVTMDAARGIHPNGAIAVDAGRIVDCGPAAEIAHRWRPRERVDATGQMVIPGFVDCHNHAALPGLLAVGSEARLGRGRYPQPEPRSMFSHGGDLAQLMQHVALWTNGPADPELTYVASLTGIALMIRGGVTTFNDGGAGGPEELCRAAHDSGIRACVSVSLADMVCEDGGASLARRYDTDQLLARADEFLAAAADAGQPRVHRWVSLMMGLSASDELCRGAAALSELYGCGVSSHLATLRNEDAATVRFWGRRAVPRFAELGLVGPRFLGIHMGWVTDEDIDEIERSDARVAHCPMSSTRLAAGYYVNGKIDRMVRRGIKVGLGTDTWTLATMLQSLATASSAAREVSLDPGSLDASAVFEMATRGSAAASLLDREIGSIEAGKRADLTFVDLSGLHWQPAREPIRVLTELGRSEDIQSVMVDGRFLMRDRRLLTIDEDALKARFCSLVEQAERARRPLA